MREGEEYDPRVANSSPGRLGNFPTSNLGNSACLTIYSSSAVWWIALGGYARWASKGWLVSLVLARGKRCNNDLNIASSLMS